MVQNIESTFIEPILSLLPESTRMDQEFESPIVEQEDQDFKSPIIEQEVLPLEWAQASGSSFEAPELDISKGKSKLPESESVDVALLWNRVFDLELSSIEKDLIIGK
ncbi:unnamed protein product [Lactuca saligna]|uniref:Uncharacterized protein n=1 Tax=Lactuca saligna TaxID=75948 RepID=A0AA35V533_LACSI|nr:unnamed protein product [Lactuca saligna]